MKSSGGRQALLCSLARVPVVTAPPQNREETKMKAVLAAVIAAPLMFALSGCSQHHVATTASGKTVYGEQAQIIDRLRNAGENLKQLMDAPDKAIPQDVLANAKCVAVVPDMVKGGFVFGANHGRGVATCRTGEGWSQPAFFAITGGSWGAP